MKIFNKFANKNVGKPVLTRRWGLLLTLFVSVFVSLSVALGKENWFAFPALVVTDRSEMGAQDNHRFQGVLDVFTDGDLNRGSGPVALFSLRGNSSDYLGSLSFVDCDFEPSRPLGAGFDWDSVYWCDERWSNQYFTMGMMFPGVFTLPACMHFWSERANLGRDVREVYGLFGDDTKNQLKTVLDRHSVPYNSNGGETSGTDLCVGLDNYLTDLNSLVWNYKIESAEYKAYASNAEKVAATYKRWLFITGCVATGCLAWNLLFKKSAPLSSVFKLRGI
ncbi:MAG: hypothetical protein LBJ77_02315 [Holosporales bacterium]|jgi:hypothetical protein|nr:hypothetical protein [Holosporales bacterium]